MNDTIPPLWEQIWHEERCRHQQLLAPLDTFIRPSWTTNRMSTYILKVGSEWMYGTVIDNVNNVTASWYWIIIIREQSTMVQWLALYRSGNKPLTRPHASTDYTWGIFSVLDKKMLVHFHRFAVEKLLWCMSWMFTCSCNGDVIRGPKWHRRPPFWMGLVISGITRFLFFV